MTQIYIARYKSGVERKELIVENNLPYSFVKTAKSNSFNNKPGFCSNASRQHRRHCKGSRAGLRKHLNVVIIQLTKTHRFTSPPDSRALFVSGLYINLLCAFVFCVPILLGPISLCCSFTTGRDQLRGLNWKSILLLVKITDDNIFIYNPFVIDLYCGSR